MKLGVYSDLHGDYDCLRNVHNFMNAQGVEIVLCAGNVLGPLFTHEESTMLIGCERSLENINRKFLEDYDCQFSFKDLLSKIKAKDEPGKRVLGMYAELISKAEEEAKKQYQLFRDYKEGLNAELLAVPGNWDTQDFMKTLHNYSLHKWTLEQVRNSLDIRGYGGYYEEMTGFVPHDQAVPFKVSELIDCLGADGNPDILLTHCPPELSLEELKRGTFLINSEMERVEPTILAYGHSHVPRHILNKKTTLICPGKLGDYRVYRDGEVIDNKKNFMILDLDDETFLKGVSLYQIDSCTSEEIRQVEIFRQNI